MNAAVSHDNLSRRLLLLLSRWALATAVLLLTTTIFYSGAGRLTLTDTALGPDYAELMQAARNPAFYHLATLSESFHWLMIGGTLLILSLLFARRAPVRAAFIAVCALGQTFGSLGSLLRLDGIGAVAAQYAAAAPSQQAGVLQSFLDLNHVINPPYDLATVFLTAGFLLGAWSAWRAFPRWLAVCLGITGLLGFTLLLPRLAGLTAGMLPMIVVNVLALIGLHLTIAIAFWRPSAMLLSSTARAPAAE